MLTRWCHRDKLLKDQARFLSWALLNEEVYQGDGLLASSGNCGVLKGTFGRHKNGDKSHSFKPWSGGEGRTFKSTLKSDFSA